MSATSHKTGRRLRCAIYTRKSTERGLEQEFNSLDAQRAACEAYIKSQISEGWHVLSNKYDDAAFSGGNLARPGLQKLLQDIEAGRIDVVVVYKIDRLTRSLADFAKLVEIFEARVVSFVAVTQQFNTTTSMGRLTLNVLLSFAQFERELASERVRDKVAASRRKGKWMGGSLPLGYDVKNKKLIVNPTEARIVRFIFRRYLVLKSVQRLIEDLDQKGIVTKRRKVKDRAIGGIAFRSGALAYLLKNRLYIGESGYSGSWFPGEHQPIIDRNLFDDVQALMKSNTINRKIIQHNNRALLTGVLFDDRGNRMSASFSVKNGVRYPCYVSAPLLRGRKGDVGSVGRLPAAEIETVILKAVRDRVREPTTHTATTPQVLIEQNVERVVIAHDQLQIGFKSSRGAKAKTVRIAWSKIKRRNLATVEAGALAQAPKQSLVQAIVRAHFWLRLIEDGSYPSIAALATAVNLHPKIVRNGLRMAFLAPAITEAVLQGTAPQELTISSFKNELPLSWERQKAKLGFKPSFRRAA